jgi:hypothetical protein
MSRRFIRTAFILAATLTASAVMFAAPLPASAANNHLKETSGSYRVGAPNLALYAPVVETTSGRDVNLITAPTGADDVYIKFSADTSLCVAAANNSSDVVIHPCSGGSGIIWTLQDSASGHCLPYCLFKNRLVGLYLAGNNRGGQFQLKPHPLGGWYEAFTVE